MDGYPTAERNIEVATELYRCMEDLIGTFPEVHGFTVRDGHIELVTKWPLTLRRREKIRAALVKFTQRQRSRPYST